MAAHGTQAVDRAAELLTLVVGAVDAPQFGELVTETGLAKSTASRLLQALERHHLVQRDDQGGYSPGAMFVQYSARHDRVEELVRLAMPSLVDVNEQTGETVNLAVPHGSTVVQVAQIDARFVLGVTNWVDVRVPAHCSALGKVCFAYGGLEIPDAELARLTDKTIVTADELRRELRKVERQGYATTESELEVGLDGVATPVLGPDGRLLAALGISGPSERIGSQVERLAHLLAQAASDVARRLGARASHHRTDPRSEPRNEHGKEGAA